MTKIESVLADPVALPKLRTIPEIAGLIGISKSELYRWANAGRLKVKKLGSGSKPQMRTTLKWVQDAIDALPDL